MPPSILLDLRHGVGLITINRPERHNAFNQESGAMFEQAMADFGLDPQVKAIVITGTGDRSFCPGADVENLDAMANEGDPTTRIRKIGEPNPLDALSDAPMTSRMRYSAPKFVGR